MTSRDAHDAALLFFSPSLHIHDDATADSTSSHVHDIDIDRRNQTNHASSFVLPLGHLLGTSYGIHTGSTPPWRFWDTVQQIQQAHRFVNTSDASNSVAKSSHASLIIGDFNSKVGCVIAVCVSYMFTTFYLMSICLTPLDVPPVRMHPASFRHLPSASSRCSCRILFVLDV